MKKILIYTVAYGLAAVSYLVFRKSTDYPETVYFAAFVLCAAAGIWLGKSLDNMKANPILSVSFAFTMMSYMLFQKTTDFSDCVNWAAALASFIAGNCLGKLLAKPAES